MTLFGHRLRWTSPRSRAPATTQHPTTCTRSKKRTPVSLLRFQLGHLPARNLAFLAVPNVPGKRSQKARSAGGDILSFGGTTGADDRIIRVEMSRFGQRHNR